MAVIGDSTPQLFGPGRVPGFAHNSDSRDYHVRFQILDESCRDHADLKLADSQAECRAQFQSVIHRVKAKAYGITERSSEL
ncbi:hypothetical protein AMTR_s00046p00076640 [Amborella trichopoda]|uniref:Uncharacterized protein n=1 Tax=Amborella trichopoda TaxID=13333 RepID=U5CX95_AMBTC|nr:hypothetical protein AMTR_s00046p00076640 [Amborella trichopoda]